MLVKCVPISGSEMQLDLCCKATDSTYVRREVGLIYLYSPRSEEEAEKGANAQLIPPCRAQRSRGCCVSPNSMKSYFAMYDQDNLYSSFIFSEIFCYDFQIK